VRGIQITSFGGPETLVVSDLAEPLPGDGEQVFDVLAAGINYADTHQTEDTYLSRQSLPFIPGGEVLLRGRDGGRLIGMLAGGGYAERVAADPSALLPVPDAVGDGAALATLVQGATAWHLLKTSTHLQPGESVVIHAGAGGVGTLAIQLAKRWGAGRVIATASNADKRALALELGADEAVDSTSADLTQVLRAANGGRGVDVVLEMTGGAVFDQSLAALAPLGRLAVFGMAGRLPPTPVVPALLMARSTAVIGFWLAHVLRRPAMFAAAVTDLLGLVAAGEIRPIIGGTYGLDQAADAHRALLSRESVGKLVLDTRR
jgi:NADPH2:quinone reductase